MAFGKQQYRYSSGQVTAQNAPLWQARRRLGPKREMMDAYFGAPTFADADTGYALKMKGDRYRAKLAHHYRRYFLPRRPKDWWRHK